jgi:hypothetical protein
MRSRDDTSSRTTLLRPAKNQRSAGSSRRVATVQAASATTIASTQNGSVTSPVIAGVCSGGMAWARPRGRVRRSAGAAQPRGVSGAGRMTLPRSRSRPALKSPAGLLQGQPLDVAATHVVGGLGRLGGGHVERHQGRFAEAQRRFERLTDLELDAEIDQLQGMAAVVGADEHLDERELVADQLG